MHKGSHRCLVRLAQLLLGGQRKMQEVGGFSAWVFWKFQPLTVAYFYTYIYIHLGWGENASIGLMLQMTPCSLIWQANTYTGRLVAREEFSGMMWALLQVRSVSPLSSLTSPVDDTGHSRRLPDGVYARDPGEVLLNSLQERIWISSFPALRCHWVTGANLPTRRSRGVLMDK